MPLNWIDDLTKKHIKIDIISKSKKVDKKLENARRIVYASNQKNLPPYNAKVKPYFADIDKDTIKNQNWRKTPYTGKGNQVVLMSINPGDNIENEIHPYVDQFFRIEQGNAKFVLNNGKTIYYGKSGSAVVVPQNTWHKVINTSKTQKLKLYTIYSPSNHPPNTFQKKHPKND